MVKQGERHSEARVNAGTSTWGSARGADIEQEQEVAVSGRMLALVLAKPEELGAVPGKQIPGAQLGV